MHDNDLIKKIINNYGRGFSELDREKLSISIKFIVKYFFLFFIRFRESKTTLRAFKLHLPSELDESFTNLAPISSYNSSDKSNSFFKQYYYLCLSCVFRKNFLGVYFFKLAYKSLDYKLDGESIVVVNAGPSFFTHLFSYYCYKKRGSKFYFIQHGVYQLDYEPYVFEKYFDEGLTILLWSKLLMQNLAKVCKSHMTIVPTYKFTEISLFNDLNTEENSRTDILFVGESINKLDNKYDEDYLVSMLKIIAHFKKQYNHCTFYFKPHPRMKNKKGFCDMLNKEYDIIIVDNISEIKIDFAVAHISTYLLELLSKGIRCFQMHIKNNTIQGSDYTKYTSVVSSDELLNGEIDAGLYFDKNYVNDDYLLIDPNFKERYKQIINL